VSLRVSQAQKLDNFYFPDPTRAPERLKAQLFNNSAVIGRFASKKNKSFEETLVQGLM